MSRTDPIERLNDYRESLRFYLSVPSRCIDRIVLADNSNSDIGELRRVVAETGADKDVELISFNGLDYPPACGRAYGEFKLIDRVMDSSRILSRLAMSDVFWKVTGRLRVTNIVRLIADAPRGYDLYVDLRRRRRWCELRVWSASIRGYRGVLRDLYATLDQRKIGIPENCLYDHLIRIIGGRQCDLRVVSAFQTVPRIEGISGWNNRAYLTGRERWAYWGRVICRKVAPWLDA